jgi:hypothetical protein
MATKNGFSKGWQGFVDHKWNKKLLAPRVAKETLPRIRIREQELPRLSK